MKTFLFLSLLFTTTLSYAIPLTCVSEEKIGDVATLRFKINNKVTYQAFNGNWKLHMIGVSPAEGFRKIVYGSGVVNETTIGLTFVKADYVIGRVSAKLNKKKGYFEGEAGIDIVDNGRILAVKCIESDREDEITD